MLISGAEVLLPDGAWHRADVRCLGGRIAAIGELAPGTDEEVHDVGGALVAPGFVDVQINGGWGHDFTSDPTSIASVAAALPATGTTSFLATIVSPSAAQQASAMSAFARCTGVPGAATPLGLHFEGPLISSGRLGAHDAGRVAAASPDEASGWTRGSGVRMVTLAPEVPGALDVIGRLATDGVLVSIGHTGCSAELFAQARRLGATAVTHLFNAMAPFHHRQPGPIGATLADPTVVAGLICDGLHVHPSAVAAAWRALGPGRVMLVSDAAAPLGLVADGGRVELGGVTLLVGADGVRTVDGVLAGTNLSMDAAVRRLVEFTGCSTGEALQAASATPCAALGIVDRGRIEVGARADLVVLDRTLHVRRTFVGGVASATS